MRRKSKTPLTDASLMRQLDRDETGDKIAYWRSIIEKVTAPHDAAMVVSPERWAEALTWALDELEAKSK